MDIIKEWTSLLMPELHTRASCRKGLKRISAELSLIIMINNDNEILINGEPPVYTRARRAVQRKEKKKKKKKKG